MLNFKLLRQALEKLKNAGKRHESVRKAVEHASVRLFEQRQRAARDVVPPVQGYVNSLANSPKEFGKTVAEYRIQVSRFDDRVRQLQITAAQIARIGSATGTAGTLAGAGVAMFGPTAAMAIATTFGTASTGTAISALSGAAATNAALAWLGGGVVAAGGGGMTGGQALLALAGPVGWTIGIAAIASSGVYLNVQNRKLAEEAARERLKIEAEIRKLETAEREIHALEARTVEHADGILNGLAWLEENAAGDYRTFNQAQKERLAALINHIRSLSELLRKEVAL